jgi:phosphoribosylformylglycinamidine cyclo-ligase
MVTYKDAGVDIEAGYEAVKPMNEPVLVSGTDGVGTKLKIAFMMDKHDTIGIDCVAMCVNDIICAGAEPLFFLDYIAVGKNEPEKVAEIVKGVADGCIMSGCSLIGGETAEMPGFYPVNEYDLVGFAVGIVEKSKIIDGKDIVDGDKIIGLASSGIHSNGYSLVRKVFNLNENKLMEHIEVLGGRLGDELLKPTKIYVKDINALNSNFKIKGISHITGGGFYENLPRAVPEGMGIYIYEGSWRIPEIFNVIKDCGDINMKHMYNTFNMGIGMAVIVDPKTADDIKNYADKNNIEARIIGEVTKKHLGVEIC